MAHVQCKVPVDFDLSDPVILLESNQEKLQVDQLDLGDGLLEVYRAHSPFIKVPIGNHSKHDVTLPWQIAFGSIQPISKIIETDQVAELSHVEVNSADTTEDFDSNGAEVMLYWDPPVDISHLTEEQKNIARKMLYEESLAFAHND